jgi:N-acyl-D-amino-acid deacylase
MTQGILVKGGLVIDGSGRPGEIADVVVRGQQIAAVGPLLEASAAARVIDAAGLAVAPGFIDIKTHSDFTLPINPTADSKVRQGVTTEIIGHCGYSTAPILSGRLDLVRDYLSASAPWLPFRETRFAQYLDTFPATSVNAGMLIGHHTLRLNAMGMKAEAPSPSELAAMAALLEEGLVAGALGLSTGLFTPPGSYAERDEIHTLCRVLKRHNGLYFTHLRDEADGVITAVEEAIEVARETGVHVEIVHLKCSGTDNWGKAGHILDRIGAARAEGLGVDCDAYPYTAGSNPLKNLLPQWVQADGVERMLARLALPETRARMRAEIDRDGLNNWGRIPDWDAVQISISPHLPEHAGKTFGELAAEQDKDPLDAVCDYLVADKGGTRVLITSISEDDIRAIVRSPLALVGSDGNCVADYGVTSQGKPHPRFYGTFPRVLSRYVEDERLLPLEAAVHKMTGATATALRLRDRGLLRPGYRADIAIFDPHDFRDRATYADPHQYPSGQRTTVLVNGVIVVDTARHTGALPGRVLRRTPDGSVG